MIEAKGLSKVYAGKTEVIALAGVDLRIEASEMVAVMGPSGSGKSTLLHLLGGLDVPTRGALTVAGRDLGRMSEHERTLFRRTQVAYIFQAFHLMPTLTATENVALPLHLQGVAPREASRRAGEALAKVGLEPRQSHLPDELSGGERQRVAIARALVTQASLLLADEPTGNLDSARGEEILGLLERLRREQQATLVMVTHDPQAAAHCARVLHLRDGRIERDERR